MERRIEIKAIDGSWTQSEIKNLHKGDIFHLWKDGKQVNHPITHGDEFEATSEPYMNKMGDWNVDIK